MLVPFYSIIKDLCVDSWQRPMANLGAWEQQPIHLLPPTSQTHAEKSPSGLSWDPAKEWGGEGEEMGTGGKQIPKVGGLKLVPIKATLGSTAQTQWPGRVTNGPQTVCPWRAISPAEGEATSKLKTDTLALACEPNSGCGMGTPHLLHPSGIKERKPCLKRKRGNH